MAQPSSMFDAPPPVASAVNACDFIPPDLGHGLRIWWAFYWRTALTSMLLPYGVNRELRFFFGPAARIRMTPLYAQILYYLIAFVVIGYILRKNFQHFRVSLLSNRGGEGAKILAPTFPRTFRVWWVFSWRAVTYRVIAGFVVAFPLRWIVGFLAHFLSPRQTIALNWVVAIILDAVVGAFVIYSSILDEDISDFRVALLPRTVPNSSPSTAATPANLANY
jgi:hypothetical protein